MKLRYWTPRKIGRLWLIAAVIQGLLLLPWAIEQYRLHHPPPLVHDPSAPTMGELFARMDSTERREMLQHLRDSLGVAVEVRDDSVTAVRLTPEGEAKLQAIVEPMAQGVADIMDRLWPLLVLVLVMMVSPTLVATGVTLAWLWIRRKPHVALSATDI